MTTPTIPTIERAPGFKVGTQFFTMLAEAQKEALKEILKGSNLVDVPSVLIVSAAQVVAILSPPKELRSRAVRKDKGTRRGWRKRLDVKPATVPTQVAA